tara:strand:+ start:939 stop:1118 length:180 start_codon:yes stop_codon:yes gene_type:complete
MKKKEIEQFLSGFYTYGLSLFISSALGIPVKTGSVMLSGKGCVFSSLLNKGNTTKKWAK